MIEPVWTIQKVQKDTEFSPLEKHAYKEYVRFVKMAERYIAQETDEQVSHYNHYMSRAIQHLQELYHNERDDQYTFTCGKRKFKTTIPGIPVYVTQSNYLSRYLSFQSKTYLVFWKRFGRYNIAYVDNKTRPEFDFVSAMLAYDFTCQERTTLMHPIFAFVPHNPPKQLCVPYHPLSCWTSCQDGRQNSGKRQLVMENEVQLNRRTLDLMYPGLRKQLFTYAHKIGTAMWLNSSQDAQVLYLWSGLYQAETRQGWCETAKKVSLTLKPVVRVSPKRICKLVEADSLANRHEEDELDWAEEKKIRTTPVDNLIPVSYIYEQARRIFATKRANGIRPRRQNIDTFTMELPMSIPDGAWYEPTKPKDSKLRGTLAKAGLSDNAAGSKAIHILNCTPQEVAQLLKKDTVNVTTQIKVEWSKLRALYPTDVASNLQCAFVAGEVEKFLPANCLIGAGYSDDKVASIINWYEETGYGISAGQDYKGFNEQHKRVGMIAVMRAWTDVYRSDLHPEQIDTMELITANFHRHRITFPDGSQCALQDTLMSGSRWTTFLNTMFNYIYSRFIHQIAHVEAVTFHVGDDVYGRYHDLQDAERVIYFANRLNVHMQVNKCFVYGSSEFLRKQYISGRSYQYLCRSIATLVHSRWERDEPVRLKERLEGVYNRLLNFFERGGNMTTILWGKLLERVSSGKTDSVKTQYMLSLPSSRGGVRSRSDIDSCWTGLLNRLNLWRYREDAYIIEDEKSLTKVYREIEKLPLIKYAARRILEVTGMPLTLYSKMKSFLSHRFSSSVKFDATKLVIDSTLASKISLAQTIDRTNELDATYSRVHPFVRAMYAARRRGRVKRWLYRQLR